MARKSVERSLPPLEKVFPGFNGFEKGENHSASIFRMLKAKLPALRHSNSRPFYAMREMAAFFGVPLSNMLLVYKRLADEGFLIRVRSSVTLLTGKQIRRKRPVRAICGLPIWLPGFLAIQGWPQFYVGLEEELRRQNILTNFLFYKSHEDLSPAFAQQILDRDLDYVLFPLPPARARSTMGLLADHGVKLIVVGDGSWEYPGQQYVLNWDKALLEALKEWKSSRITSVVISVPSQTSAIHTAQATHLHEVQVLKQALKAFEMPFTFVENNGIGIPSHVAGLKKGPSTGIICVNYFWIASLFNQAPGEMTHLCQTRRVLLTRLPVNVPLLGREAPADLLLMNWKRVSQQIARDLVTQNLCPKKMQTFFASYQPKVNLATLR